MMNIFERMILSQKQDETGKNGITRKDFLITSSRALGAAMVSPYLLWRCSSSGSAINPAQAQKNVINFYAKVENLGIGKVTPQLEALVQYMYTPEESVVVQHLFLFVGRTSNAIFRDNDTGGMSESQIEAVLWSLAQRQLLFHYGHDQMEDLAAHFDNRTEPSTYPHTNPTPPMYYSLISLLPGLFEYSLGKGAAHEPWRQELARRWEALYESGYSKDLWLVQDRSIVTRYIPIEKTINRDYTTFPSDSISEVLKGTASIGVCFCQCKQARGYSGFTDCISSTMETCMVTGVLADHLIGKGVMRRVDFSEALDIKVKANESGLVTWGLNLGEHQANFYCSCCKCCCYILRNMTQYNLPGLHVQPNYYPMQKENTTCVTCGKCVSACPVNARTFVNDSEGNRHYVEVDESRCIGCGVCNVKCPQGILTMKRFDNAKPAPEDFGELAVEFGTYFATQQIKKLLGLS